MFFEYILFRFLKINIFLKIELVYSMHFGVLYKMVKKIFWKKFFPGVPIDFLKKIRSFLISPLLKSFKTMLKSTKFLFTEVFRYEEHDGDLIFYQKIFYAPLKIGVPLKNQKFITNSNAKKIYTRGFSDTRNTMV